MFVDGEEDMNTFFADLTAVSSQTWALKGNFFRVSWLWLLVSAILMIMGGVPVEGADPSQMQRIVMFQVASMLALIVLWYRVHQSIIPVSERASKQAYVRFVGTQMALLVSLVMLATSVVSLFVTAVNFNDYAHMTLQDDIVPPVAAPSVWQLLATFSFMFLVFIRLALVAPLAARGEQQCVRRSWSATSGNFFRLAGLLLVTFVPTAVGMALSETIVNVVGTQQGFPPGAVLNIMCTALSFWLLAVLSEAEYQRLKP
jgi:hypothetical protein